MPKFEYCMVQQNFTLKKDEDGLLFANLENGVKAYGLNFQTQERETILAVLGDLGQDGWEMCGINTHSKPVIFYFKRAIE